MARPFLLGIFLLCALSGPVRAATLLDGWTAYDRGDYAGAAEYFQANADQGNEYAQEQIATMFEIGQGVPQNYSEAMKWHLRAANQGDPLAEYHLGVIYANGQLVPRDYAAAAGWYRKAADHDYAYAQYYLGIMFESGLGVARDPIEAHMWLNVAAANPSIEGRENRENSSKARDALGLQMTREQVAAAQAKALREEAKIGEYYAQELDRIFR